MKLPVDNRRHDPSSSADSSAHLTAPSKQSKAAVNESLSTSSSTTTTVPVAPAPSGQTPTKLGRSSVTVPPVGGTPPVRTRDSGIGLRGTSSKSSQTSINMAPPSSKSEAANEDESIPSIPSCSSTLSSFYDTSKVVADEDSGVVPPAGKSDTVLRPVRKRKGQDGVDGTINTSNKKITAVMNLNPCESHNVAVKVTGLGLDLFIEVTEEESDQRL
ncbi:hypothetical protein V496_00609 [Pseudogymnoascus sp. VKM F-4515 (FW-2607)]|nr:hypothetical protein V496_00609 [Pseudogymnoascus sp. VKM F-4515 (FW-2607)]